MQYRFTLTDYTIVPAGTVTVLSDEPIGFNNLEIMIKRDPVWHGCFFETSVKNLGFVGDGYDVIKSAYNDSGLNAQTDLLIEVDCDGSGTFDTVYLGRLQYDQYSDNMGDPCIISIALEQRSCLRTLKSRYDQKVNILATETFEGTALPTYDRLAQELFLPSKPVVLKTDAVKDESFGTGNYGFVGSDSFGDTYTRLFEFQFLVQKDDILAFAGIHDNHTSIGSPTSYSSLLASEVIEPTFEYTGETFDCVIDPTEFTVSITMSGTMTNSRATVPGGSEPFNCSLRLFHFNSSNALQSDTLLQDFSDDYLNTPVVEAVSINYSGNFSINTGDKFYLVLCHDHIGTGDQYSTLYTDSEFSWNAQIESICEETPSQVALINEALSRTAEIITDDCLRVYSDYFGRTDSEPFNMPADGCAGFTGITNGLYIRRATRTDGSPPEIFVSLKSLFDGLNAIHNIGMGIENRAAYGDTQTLRIEPVRFFYSDTVIHTCTNVKEITNNILTPKAYGKVEIGYQKWESEYTGGLDDLHSKREYRTHLEAVNNTLRQHSELIASTYAIEVTRRQQATTTDYKYDNDIFIICLDRQYGSYIVEIFYDLITNNILSPDNLYNVRITPARNLLRWYKSIRTRGSDRLNFNAGDANYIGEIRKTGLDNCLLETQNTPLKENNNISPNLFKDATDAAPVFLPETTEFEYPLSYTDFKAIQANPTGKVVVTQGSVTQEGWINTLTYNPVEGMAKWNLIREYQ